MSRIPREDRAGLYITIIVHLSVVIIALLAGLERNLRVDNSFIVDFSKVEELEKMLEQQQELQKELQRKEDISAKVDRMLSQAGNPIRNIPVNRGELKDDRGTDAKKLYEDAAKLQRELKAGYELPDEELNFSDQSDISENDDKPAAKEQYSGPSVLDWYLEGRQASRLPIPAYRCMGAGEVKVLIEVDPQGTVSAAKVDESCSSKDGCLRSFAIRAARTSKFSKSPSAPARQSGYIIYQFIAQ